MNLPNLESWIRHWFRRSGRWASFYNIFNPDISLLSCHLSLLDDTTMPILLSLSLSPLLQSVPLSGTLRSVKTRKRKQDWGTKKKSNSVIRVLERHSNMDHGLRPRQREFFIGFTKGQVLVDGEWIAIF